MSLNTLRSPSPERSPSPACSISSDSTTFSFEDDPFAHSILEEVIEPAIKAGGFGWRWACQESPTILATTTTPPRTFTLPISPPKPNARAEYDIIRERLEAYGDSYSTGTRPSEGYLWKQYEMNIEGERTRVYLKARKTTLPPSTMTEACNSESQIWWGTTLALG